MSEDLLTLNLNRIQRISLWCKDCNNYWQIPNHLVVLSGIVRKDLINRLARINLYLYRDLLQIDVDKIFGSNYKFEFEVVAVFQIIKEELVKCSPDIEILKVDIINNLVRHMSSLSAIILELRSTFFMVSNRIQQHSSKKFLTKLGILKKNICRALETENYKTVIDNLMDLNTAGFDVIIQFVGILLNCFYILLIKIEKPENVVPGVVYCVDVGVVIERLANLSMQNFLYKYKRRWLIYYRDILVVLKSKFTDVEKFNKLYSSGNVEDIEEALYEMLITNNSNLKNALKIMKYDNLYHKDSKQIYDWWVGQGTTQIQTIVNFLDDSLDKEKKSTILPFLLTYKDHPKDRLFEEIKYIIQSIKKINQDCANSMSSMIRIYPRVYEQVWFPDREHYIHLNNLSTTTTTTDIHDSIKNKNMLRKCENQTCQRKHNGSNVIWNLNTFEIGKESLNNIIKEFLKNPLIISDIFNFVQKNVNLSNQVKKIINYR